MLTDAHVMNGQLGSVVLKLKPRSVQLLLISVPYRRKMVESAEKKTQLLTSPWWEVYADYATHPDLSHAVGAVLKFNSKPTEAHLTVYLKHL